MIAEFIDYEIRVRNYTAHTAKAYGTDLRLFAGWLAMKGVNRWSLVTKNTIDNYLKDLHDREQEPSTIRRKVAAIRAFYDFAMIQGKISVNPARYVESPKQKRKEVATIPAESIEQYIDDTTNPIALRAIIALIYESGLRISEVMNLDTTHVDPKTRRILVDGKGMKERSVYYGERTRKTLNEYLGGRRGRVFLGADERTIRYNIWQALIAVAGPSRKASPHIIRHTFASEMVKRGCPLTSVQNLLGHEHITTTEKYLHVGDEQTRQDYMRAQA